MQGIETHAMNVGTWEWWGPMQGTETHAVNVGTCDGGDSALSAKRSPTQGIEPMQENTVNVGTWEWWGPMQ